MDIFYQDSGNVWVVKNDKECKFEIVEVLNDDKIFIGVYRNEEGKLSAASVHWPYPPCISYFRADLNTWFYKSLNDADYVAVRPTSTHAIDCFEQIKKELTKEEVIKYSPRQNIPIPVDNIAIEI